MSPRYPDRYSGLPAYLAHWLALLTQPALILLGGGLIVNRQTA
ncbi:MAG: hypothetical protein OXC96_07505 [Cyanobacteria bacterium MAG CAR1_bin_15]|nr:hypothetical protein [Cyanobacteria bacterium MAG CAR1_bin_15]